MGILSKLFGSKTTETTYAPKSEKEAWIGIMYACTSTAILQTLKYKKNDVVGKLPLFRRKQIADYYQPNLLANRKVGSYNLIDGSVALIEEDQNPLLFNLIIQLLLADEIYCKRKKKLLHT